MQTEIIEAKLASLKRIEGRPVATISELHGLTGVPASTLFLWRKQGLLEGFTGSLVFADTLIPAITRKRNGGSFPKGQKRQLENREL